VAEQTTERMVVEASPARCFAVVADIERYPDWVGDLKEVHVLERDDESRPVVVAFRAAAFGRGAGTSPIVSTASTDSSRLQVGAQRSPTSSSSSCASRSLGSSNGGQRATSCTQPSGI
jgi:hypothetical protein